MSLLHKISGTLLMAASLTAAAQDPWLHIYYPSGSDYQGYDMTQVLDVTFDDATGTMTINQEDGTTVTAYATKMDYFHVGANVASLRIVTDIPDIYEVESKKEYLDATLYFEGRGHQDDFEMPVRLRGRGNSTWSYDKKPYRLKFTEKQRLLLPKKAKNFVLLANFIDPAMMRNFAAFKFGETIGMPWIHHTQPVDVYLNDYYKGSYMITEKVGFNNGSVNIKAVDEPNSIMLELDNNNIPSDKTLLADPYFASDSIYLGGDDILFKTQPYDYSSRYNFFPAKIKDPDAPADTTEIINWVKKWRTDFNRFMTTVASGNETAIFEQCDIESLVRYVMVFNFCCNQEIDHPKSVFVYKTEGGKWNFGPCWDFDWAFGYNPTYYKGFSGSSWGFPLSPSYENPLFGCGHNDAGNPEDGNAGIFFYKLCKTNTFQTRFNEVWDEFMENGIDQFWNDFDAYAESLRPSANLQGLSRSSYQGFDKNVDELRSWIESRISFINTDPNHGLWEDGVFNKY